MGNYSRATEIIYLAQSRITMVLLYSDRVLFVALRILSPVFFCSVAVVVMIHRCELFFSFNEVFSNAGSDHHAIAISAKRVDLFHLLC